jgi:hypothetical protein
MSHTWKCPTSPQQCPNPEPPPSTEKSRILRGQVSKHNRTTDKNLNTRDWRGAFSILIDHRKHPIRKKY